MNKLLIKIFIKVNIFGKFADHLRKKWLEFTRNEV